MNAHAREFKAEVAKRERVPLLVGLAGPSSSGKTKSALRIADGIRAITGGEIYGIDTEARRMLHYAGEHQFKHVEFNAPFGARDYLQAIRFCVGHGAKVVIIDSMSHEHEGPGGLIETQEAELERLAGTDYNKRERMKMLAWQKPKAARRELINGLLQLNANFIFCFRAREKTKPMVQPDGKTKPIELGFMPIAGEEFLFEMTANVLLLPKSGGIPTWTSEHLGERGIMKLPGYLAHAFKDGQPLSEDTGRALAVWARGDSSTHRTNDTARDAAKAAPASAATNAEAPPRAGAASSSPAPSTATGQSEGPGKQPASTTAGAAPDPAAHNPTGSALSLQDEAREAAKRGEEVFNAFWRRLRGEQKQALQAIGEELRGYMREAGK